jgi:hypothetical protein
MEQIAQFVGGERDYTKIEGGTGPLVYPAAHVYTFTGLYYITGEGKNIFLAQQIFAVLYMATLALVMLCYWKAKVRTPSTLKERNPSQLDPNKLTQPPSRRSRPTSSRS